MPCVQSPSPIPGANRSRSVTCVKCGYDLTGLQQQRCPECGLAIDSAEYRTIVRNGRIRRCVISLLVMALVTYAPYAWLVLIDYGWSDYRWSWIRMWLALPVILPASFITRRLNWGDVDDGAAVVALSIISVGLVFALAIVCARRIRFMLIVAAIVLALSSLNSLGLYNVFLM